MKGLLRFELRRRWRSPGTWLFLFITLAASGIACLLKNVYGGSSDFETVFSWGMYSLILAAPLLNWGSCTTERRNDAWKQLLARRISPFALAFSRLMGVWSVCLAAVLAMLGGPAVLCLLFDSLYFPGVLCAAAAFLSVACLTSAFCLWLESCAQRAWQAALSGAICLGIVYLLSLLAAFSLGSQTGAILSMAGLTLALASLPILLGVSAKAGVILSLSCVIVLGGVLVSGGHQTMAQLLTAAALFDQMDVFMLGIFDLSIMLSCLVIGLLFAVLTGVSLMRRRGPGKGPRRFPRSVQIAAAALAVCILAVALLPLMGSSLTRMDATRVQLATPVPQAEDVLSESDIPVHAYFLSTASDAWMEALLARYAALNDRFTYSFVDLTLEPDFGDAYYGAQGQNNCLVLTGNGRYAVIPSVYIYTYTYAYDSASGNYIPTDLKFDAQSRILTAVRFLSAETAPTIGVLSGHYESQIGEYARDLAYTNGYFLTSVDLTTDTLDERYDAILIQTPQVDISAAERDLLIQYLQNGGGLMLSTNYQYGDYPNLFAVMDYCGLAPEGVLAMEVAAGYYLDYGYYPAPVAAEHEVTAYVTGNQVIVPTAHGIVRSETFRPGLSRTSLLHTSDYSYLKLSSEMTTLDPEEGDPIGPVTVAMASTDTVMRTVWVSGDHLADSAMMTSGGANLYFWLGEIQWTADAIGVSPYVETEAPSLTTARLSLTDMQKLAVTAASLFLSAVALIVAVSVGTRRIRSSHGA